MKKILAIVITLAVLIGLSFGISHYAHAKYFDYSFFVGLLVTVIIWFFSSKGEFTTRRLDAKVAGITGINMKQERFQFTPNKAFITSLIYTIVSLVIMIYQYRDYF